MGLPVIASNNGAIGEAVRDGVDGLLFEPGNSEALRRSMLKFLETPGLAWKMASNVPKVKSMAEHAAELSEIYCRVIGKQTSMLQKKSP
jgi:glycosyltransferase involved in cell wall biosynthesis